MARPITAARRYAEAAFEVAQRDDDLDRWQDDLQLAAAVLSDPGIAPVVDNPSIPADERRAIVERALGKQLAPPALRLVELLVTRGRVDLLPRVASEYRRLLTRHRGIVPAVVTSAVPLTKTEAASIRAKVEAMAASPVDLDTRVDPAIIGGLTIQLGDRLLDDSIRGRLERLRAQLHSGARAR